MGALAVSLHVRMNSRGLLVAFDYSPQRPRAYAVVRFSCPLALCFPELRRFVRAFFRASLHPVSHRVHVVRRYRTLSLSMPFSVVPTFGKMGAVGYCHSHAHLSLHVRISCPAFRPPTSVPAFSRGSPSSCYSEPHTLQAPVLPHTGCSAFLITTSPPKRYRGMRFKTRAQFQKNVRLHFSMARSGVVCVSHN